MSRKLSRLLALSVLILAVFSFPQFIQRAHAVTGVVCIAPNLAGQTACPASPVALTGPVSTGPATLIRVSVFIQVTDPMNGFEVTLLTNHLVALPVGVDLTGSIVGAGPTVLLECLQNVAVIGGPCVSTDTLDTLHLAVVAAPGAIPGGTTPPGSSGLLFTALYQIQSATATAQTIGFQTGCTVTSVASSTICINISNGTKTPVIETSQTGTFTSSSSQPFLQLSPASTNLGNAFPGTSIPAQTVTTTDMNGYGPWQFNGGIVSGDATISYVVTVTGPTSSATGITGTLAAPNPQDFSTSTGAGFAVTNSLSFTNAATTTTGLWTITVTGTYHFDPGCVTGVGCPGPASTLVEVITYTVNVEDFGFSINGSTSAAAFSPFWCPAASQGSACPASSSGVASLVVTSKGYTGTVTLANGAISPVTAPVLAAALSTTTIPGGSGTATDTFTGGLLRPSTALGSYTMSATSSGTLAANGVFAAQTKSHPVTVIVRPENFNITTSNGTPIGPSLSFASGGSMTDTLTIGSLPSGVAAGVSPAGFAGPVTISSTFTGGTGLTVTPTTTPVTLTAGHSLTDVVTFSGSVVTTTVFSVTITGTASLATSNPGTQTQSVTYSVTITGTAPPPDFTVTANPTSVSVVGSNTATSTITVAPTNGFTGIVALGAAVSPNNLLTCTLNPTSIVLGATQTSTLSCSGSAGTYTVTVTGTSGALSHSAIVTVTVTPPAVVTITTTLSSTTINVGASVTDSATLSGNTATAGGTVTYKFFASTVCLGTATVVGSPVTVTNGVVPGSASQTFNTAGSFGWTAAYSGDANNAPDSSSCEPLAVNQAAPSLSTALSANPITAGGSVTDSATLTNSFQAGGIVTYSFFTGSTCSGSATVVGAPVTVTGGVVPSSASQAFPTAGSFSWNAVYSGDTNNKAATSPCESLTVNPLSVVISTSLSSNPITVGGTVTDSATLAGATASAGGTVTYKFFSGATCSGTGTTVGSAVTVTNGIVPSSAAQAFSSAGSFSWNAVYSGDANNSGATSSCEPLTVNKASPTITTTLSSNPIPAGGSVTDSATLSGGFQASGTVTYTFFSGSACAGTGTAVGTPVTVTNGIVPGSASQTFPNAGSFSWNAAYSGDGNNNVASSACEPLTVNPSGAALSTSLSANPITVGGSVTDSTTLTGVTANAGGTVSYSFFTGSTCSGTGTVVGSPVTVLNGIVPNSASQTFNAAGSFSWKAVYSGDTNNAGATSGCEPLTVNKASPTVTTSLASSQITVGGSVTDSATLSGGFQAGGTVTYNFFSGSTCSGTPTPVGTPVTVTAGVIPNSASQTFNNAGSFSWNAAYSGDSNNNGANSGCEPFTVNKASPSITTSLSANPINQGASVIDSATLTNSFQADGTVTYTFFAGSTCTGTGTQVGGPVTVANGIVPSSGPQTFASAGSFSWNAIYSGDANNSGATSACEPLTVNTVNVVTISTALSSNSITVGGSVTDSATLSQVTSNAGGTVTYSFFAGFACSGTGTVVGSAVTVTNGLVPNSAFQTFNSVGSFSWNAVYGGDANNAGATSGCEPLTVNQASPTIATTVSATNPTVGSAVHDSATLSNGFNAGGTVTYTLFFFASACSGPSMAVSTVTISNGVVPDSTIVNPAPAGPYSFQASYSGDTNNKAATSACEPFIVAKANPTITTSLSATQISVGGSVTDSATLTGGFNALGTVSYNLFSAIDCSGSSSVVSTVNVFNGVVANSGPHAFNNAGSFGWTASYSGDINNTATTSTCEPMTVIPLTTVAITTSLSSNAITVGGSVFDTAKLTGVTANAGGTVTYTMFNGTSCGSGRTIGTVTVVNGIVPNSAPVTFMFAGSFSWNAAYSGDANNNVATSTCEPLIVNQATPSISTSLSSSQINVGESVTDSATLSNSFQAGGFVTYRLFSAADCSGTATIISNVTVTNGVVPNSASRLFNTTGTFGWNAFYSGDGNNNGATSACEPLTVSSTTGQPFLLTFQAFNFSGFHNGIGPFTVLVNGHVVANFPGHGFVSSSSTVVFGTDKWVTLGPFDITAFVIPGQNNVTFVNTFGIRFSLVRQVMVMQGSTVFLDFKGPRFISPTRSLILTFSNPPLVITSFSVIGNLVTNNTVTFTATYTGGTAPFKCIFSFGDDESTTVAGTAGSCSVTHDFDDSGNFTARVVVKGSSTSDVQTASLKITVVDSGLSNQMNSAAPIVSSESDIDDD